MENKKKKLPENIIVEKKDIIDLFGTEKQKEYFNRTNVLQKKSKISIEKTLDQYYDVWEEVKHPTKPRVKAYSVGSLRSDIALRKDMRGQYSKDRYEMFKTQNEFREHIKECYESYVVADDSDIYRNTETILKFIHLECGRAFESSFNRFSRGVNRKCGCRASKLTRMVIDYLERKNISFKREIEFDDLLSEKGFHLRYDFGIYHDDELVGLIEVDGKQHFVPTDFTGTMTKVETLRYFLNVVVERDFKKNRYCQDRGILLLRIDERKAKEFNFLIDIFIDKVDLYKLEKGLI